jgi:hypothetical protein
VLLDLGHDLRFAVAADLPFTVFGANVRAAETNFILAMFFALSNSHFASYHHAAPDSRGAQYCDSLNVPQAVSMIGR